MPDCSHNNERLCNQAGNDHPHYASAEHSRGLSSTDLRLPTTCPCKAHREAQPPPASSRKAYTEVQVAPASGRKAHMEAQAALASWRKAYMATQAVVASGHAPRLALLLDKALVREICLPW